LFDRPAYAEAQVELAKHFLLFSDDAALHGFFHWHAGFVHFLRYDWQNNRH
jgi:hypothetical protein